MSRVLGKEPDVDTTGGLHFRPDQRQPHRLFHKPPNKDVTATCGGAVSRIDGLEQRPDFLIHTGDLTHLAKPTEFDTVDQMIRGVKKRPVFYVPGEHDDFTDDGKSISIVTVRAPWARAGKASTITASILSVW